VRWDGENRRRQLVEGRSAQRWSLDRELQRLSLYIDDRVLPVKSAARLLCLPAPKRTGLGEA